MILRQYLPERSAEDILAGRIRLNLGQWFELPVLTIDENEKWQAVMVEELGGLLAGLSADSAPAAFARLAAGTDVQLRLLHAYDRDKLLPDDATIRATASNGALLRGVLEVVAAAFPLAAIVLDELTRNEDVIRDLIQRASSRLAFSQPTSLPPPSTDGTSAVSEVA